MTFIHRLECSITMIRGHAFKNNFSSCSQKKIKILSIGSGNNGLMEMGFAERGGGGGIVYEEKPCCIGECSGVLIFQEPLNV